MGLFVSCCRNQVIKLFLPAVLVLAVFRNAECVGVHMCVSAIRWEGTIISRPNISQNLLCE